MPLVSDIENDFFSIFYFIVLVDIGVEIKLSNKTFDKELENRSSPAYKELKDNVYVEVLG